MLYLISDLEHLQFKPIELKIGLNTIGRNQENSIVYADMSLSRQHATISISAEGVATLRDLQSRNGTFVNQSQISQCQIHPNDSIRFGDAMFKFVDMDFLSNPVPSIGQLSPEPTRLMIEDLLYLDNTRESKATDSVLRLRHNDANQRSLDKLRILLEVSKQLSSPEDPDKLLQKILDLMFEIMAVDRAAILMVNESTGELEAKALKTSAGISVSSDFYSKKIVTHVCNCGEPVITEDAFIDDRFETSDSVHKQLIRSLMCVPLKPRDRVIGVLYVDNLLKSSAYSAEDMEFLVGMANQAAVAIENAKLYRKIETEAVMLTKFERFFPQAVIRKLKEEGKPEIIDTEITALFADITDFTALSSKMEPRQIITLLNEYFEVMVEGIVFEFEGTLEKYIGDALLAVWGAPYQKTDDADRAVKAAIAMQWALCHLNERWQRERNLQIQIHIGINTGKVAAGNIGSQKLMQYATIGDTTNVASRVCNVAQAGEILLTKNTFDKLQNQDLPLELLPPVMVKGKIEPLQLYRLQWHELPLLDMICI